MRVVAGTWRGRRLAAPGGRETRPTSDRVREAVFSVIESRVGPLGGLHVADVYAGSGALGIEALSRGAAHVTFVDRSRQAAATIRRNLDGLDAPAECATVLVLDASSAAGHRGWGPAVALLFVDPPYRIVTAQVGRELSALAQAGALEAGAIVVYEHDVRTSVEWPSGFTGVDERRYGDTGISIATFGG